MRLRSGLMLIFLVLLVGFLYAGSLSYPLVFDDLINSGFDPVSLSKGEGFGILEWPRGLTSSTYLWTFRHFGPLIELFRLGNLVIHLANVLLLFGLLLRLFNGAIGDDQQRRIQHAWYAFMGALWFGLNPVGVYATAYLTQRSILLASMFSLLALHACLYGLFAKGDRRAGWFAITLGAYLLALLSKEHVVMLPMVMLAVAMLLRGQVNLPKYLLIGAFAFMALLALMAGLASFYVVGSAYEGHALAMLAMMGFAAGHDLIQGAYLLSILTQGWLFFEYLLRWILPLPMWLSIDLHPPFATSLLSWPQTAGFVAFLLWPWFAFKLLKKGGSIGLAGLALLWPWYMFLTELSTVRVQEIFVLYRSYFWMAGLPLLLPFLLQRVPQRLLVVLALAIVVCIMPLAADRLITFSTPYRLWDDAIAKNDLRPYALNGRAWTYRGIALMKAGKLDDAMKDMNRAIELDPWFAEPYGNRAVIYMRQGRFKEALQDTNFALQVNPDIKQFQQNRRQIIEILKNKNAP